MSSPRYGWWQYAKYMIRIYPELKQELELLQAQKVTAGSMEVRGSNTAGRTTETAALKQLSPAKQRQYDAVSKAIEITKRSRNGDIKLNVIDLVLWKATHKIDGAAIKLYIGETTARRYHGDFIRLVGYCYGFDA